MIGNTVATVVIARSENAVDMKQYKAVVENPVRISETAL
jgi:hypothetical protein